jgi:hypothetical protein
MAKSIDVEALTDYQISANGTRFRLNFKPASGNYSSITLPSDCLNQLVMTIPRIAVEVLRKQHGDDTLRLVYPLHDWALSKTTGNSHRVLTLTGWDGLEIAFAIEPDDLSKMAAQMNSEVPKEARIN